MPIRATTNSNPTTRWRYDSYHQREALPNISLFVCLVVIGLPSKFTDKSPHLKWFSLMFNWAFTQRSEFGSKTQVNPNRLLVSDGALLFQFVTFKGSWILALRAKCGIREIKYATPSRNKWIMTMCKYSEVMANSFLSSRFSSIFN